MTLSALEGGGELIHGSISREGAKDDHTCMWWRERCLVEVVGVEGENGHVIGTGIGEDG